jgi:hypothetical protein
LRFLFASSSFHTNIYDIDYIPSHTKETLSKSKKKSRALNPNSDKERAGSIDRLKLYFKEEFDVNMTGEDSEVTVTYTYLKEQQKQIKQILSVGIHNRIIL